jgi:SagB-type dehydrogenase family enzyme
MTEKESLIKERECLKREWDTLDMTATDQAKGVPPPPLEKAFDPLGTIVPLAPREEWNTNGVPLVDAILNRKSRRKYSQAALSFGELSFLLFATQGFKARRGPGSLRTVPSGGARHGFETYLYANRVDTLAPGLYRYLPVENALCLERQKADGMEKSLDAALNGQFWNAAAYFVWTAIPYRVEWRYASAAPKLLALDAGHLCQNLYLACEAVGCGTCGIGAYRQGAMDEFLGVDGVDEFTIYAAPVGKV